MSLIRHNVRDGGLSITMEEGDADESSDMALARHIGTVLNKHYPDYLWIISVQARGLVLRNHSISAVAAAFLRREGFAYLMPPHKMLSPQQVEESAVMAAGAMLELFSLPRGRAPIPDPDALAASGLVKIPADWVKRQQKHFA